MEKKEPKKEAVKPPEHKQFDNALIKALLFNDKGSRRNKKKKP